MNDILPIHLLSGDSSEVLPLCAAQKQVNGVHLCGPNCIMNIQFKESFFGFTKY